MKKALVILVLVGITSSVVAEVDNTTSPTNPAINPGDLFVAHNQSDYRGLYHLSVATGTVSYVMGEPSYTTSDLVMDDNFNVFVVAHHDGGLFKYNLLDHSHESVTSGGILLWHPRWMDIETNGSLIVATQDGKITRVNPLNGEQELVADIGGIVNDVVVHSNGYIYANDYFGFVTQIDPITGNSVVLPHAGLLSQTRGMIEDIDGQLLIANGHPYRGLVKVNQTTGEESPFVSFPDDSGPVSFNNPMGLTLGLDDEIIVSDTDANGNIFSVDRVSKELTIILTGVTYEHFDAWDPISILTYEGPPIPEPCSLTLLTPNGGEELPEGSTFEITWETTGCIENVVLEYSKNNGVDWMGIADITNTNSYQWTIPQKNSQQCLLRVSDHSGSSSDTSDETFTIYICTLRYDLDLDCNITLSDVALLASEWLQCGNPFNSNCVP